MLSSIFRLSWRAGLHGARANLLPGLALQAFALALVISYHQVPSVRASLERLSAFREQTGFAYAVVATACFGGVLPWLYLRSRRATRRRFTMAQGIALTGFWAYKGLEIDLWYRLLARLVGEGHDAATIVIKSALDQLVYCPAFAIPVSWAVYAWIQHDFRAAAVAERFRAPHWYAREVLPILISNAAVWIPAVAIIYLLPTPLQLPMQNIVLCFFTLLLAHLTQRQPANPPETFAGPVR